MLDHCDEIVQYAFNMQKRNPSKKYSAPPITDIIRAEFNIFGIKNDPVAIALIELLDHHNIDYKFFDYRDFPPSDEQLKRFADFDESDYPINLRSNLYKKNEKKFIQLTESARYNWLREHYHVLHRPIVENREEVVLAVGGRAERILKEMTGIDVRDKKR